MDNATRPSTFMRVFGKNLVSRLSQPARRRANPHVSGAMADVSIPAVIPDRCVDEIARPSPEDSPVDSESFPVKS